MDVPRREVIDTAMGDLEHGPVVYGFNYDKANLTCIPKDVPYCATAPAGKYEQFLSVS